MERRSKVRVRTLPSVKVMLPDFMTIVFGVHAKDELQAYKYETPIRMQCNICFEHSCVLKMYVTSCGHGFCFSCILHWLMMKAEENKKKTCPVCRGNMEQCVGIFTLKVKIPIKVTNSLTCKRLSIDQLKDLENQTKNQIATKLSPYQNLKLSSFNVICSNISLPEKSQLSDDTEGNVASARF